MHPQPLVRIAPHVVFDNLRKQRGVGDDVGFGVSGANQLGRGIEAQAVFLSIGSQIVKPGTTAASVRRLPAPCRWRCRPGCRRNPRTRPGWHHIGVHKHADGFAFAHGRDQAASEIFVHSFVAVQGAIGTNQAVEVGIIQRPHQHAQWISIQRVRKRRKLPRRPGARSGTARPYHGRARVRSFRSLHRPDTY